MIDTGRTSGVGQSSGQIRVIVQIPAIASPHADQHTNDQRRSAQEAEKVCVAERTWNREPETENTVGPSGVERSRATVRSTSRVAERVCVAERTWNRETEKQCDQAEKQCGQEILWSTSRVAERVCVAEQ
jgi:hypothetical protein